MGNNRIVYLEEVIAKHDHAYYTRQAPTIPDSEYDAMIVELRDLYGACIPATSVLYKPGKTLPMPGRIEKKHDRPMISLRTEVSTSIAPIEMFHKRVLEVDPDPEYVAECKYDGLAVSLKVNRGKIHSAVLRGDGEKGEDVWDTVRYVGNMKSYLDDKSITEIRGEIVMLKNKLLKCNEFRVEIGMPAYVNTRNAAAGMVRTLQTGDVNLWTKALPAMIEESLVFIPYSIFRDTGSVKQSEALEYLWREFNTYYYIPPAMVFKTPEDLYRVYQHIESKRHELPFDIDGAVYKVNSPTIQRRMGVTGREPNWAIAHKYKAEEAECTLVNIDVQVGTSGRLTPMARIVPTFVGGTTVTNITLSNVFQIRKKGIRKGDKIIIRRAGDVIPEIVGVSPNNVRKNYVRNFKMPSFCPECGGEVRRPHEMTNYECGNWECPARVIGRLTEAFAKDCLDVDGIGPAVIEALVNNLGVRTVPEVLDLTEDELIRAGIGEGTSSTIANAIADLRENPIPIDRAIRAFGIPHVGNSASRKLAPYIDGWDKGVMDFHLDEVSLTEPAVNNINDAVKKFQTEMCGIMERLQLIRPPMPGEGKLKGKIYAMSGSHPTIGRSDIQDLIVKHGGKVIGAPNKATTAFLVGSGCSASKVDKAKGLGVEIVDLSEFINDL